MSLKRIGDVSAILGFTISVAMALNVSGLAVAGGWSDTKTFVVSCIFDGLSIITAWRAIPIRKIGRAFFRKRTAVKKQRCNVITVSRNPDIADDATYDRSELKINVG